MRKVLAVVMVLVMAFTMFTGCSGSQKEESGDITMFVALGNDQEYYEALQTAIKDELGYDVTFIYKRCEDTTTAINQEFKNNDLCADIMCTASAVLQDEWLEDSCVNLLTTSDITSKFNLNKIQECTCEDDGVYQLPFTSKLIGITYNKTLMEEQGWEVPSTFDEMVDLKEKCDEEGILFAVTGDFATGHGFNWLFHLMGSQWLTGLEGTEWLEEFLEGEVSVDEFAQQASYFKKYYEAGLFGEIFTSDWNASTEFSQKRALFLYELTNSVYSYEGPQYNLKGKEIEGSQLNDEYASMPWISEDGSNNSFTYYDNMFIALNKDLEENQDKLNIALEILDFMTTDEVTSLFTDRFKDGYIAVDGYQATDTALYAKYSSQIEKGYMQPWYYSYFDADTIVNTGEQINSYIQGTGATMNDIMDALTKGTTDYLNKTNPTFGKVEETLGYEDLARFEAVCGAQALQKKLDEAGEKAEVQVSLLPYIDSESSMTPWTDDSVVNTKLYAGDFETAALNSILIQSAKSPLAVYMKGSDINAIVDAGFNDKYPIAMMTKGGIEVEDDTTYLVAVNYSTLTPEQYEQYLSDDQVLLPPEDLEAVEAIGEGLVTEGIQDYFSENDSLSPDSIQWK